jgi:single-stranded DNA-binding protein
MPSKQQPEPAVNSKTPSENSVVLSGRIDSPVISIPRKVPGAVGCRFLLVSLNLDGKTSSSFSCVAWDEPAEKVLALPTHADVRVHGRLRRSSWIDKATQAKKFDTEIAVQSIEALQ